MSGVNSRFDLTKLASRKNEMQNDGRILSNRKTIDILDHRIRQLAERIDLEEAPDRLAQFVKLWRRYRRASALDKVKIAAELDQLVDEAAHDYAAWNQMLDVLDLRRKSVESEVKILKEIQAIITAEDAYDLLAEAMAAIMRVVDDPRKMKQIQYEFTRIIGEGPSEDDGRGGREIITLDSRELDS